MKITSYLLEEAMINFKDTELLDKEDNNWFYNIDNWKKSLLSNSPNKNWDSMP